MSIISRLRLPAFPVFILSALLAIGGASPIMAQGESTPASGTISGSSSETAAQLPAADLPSMNQQGYIFELESTYNGTFTQLPEEAPVYAMQFQNVDADRAQSVASGLGIDGDVEDKGNGTFNAQGEGGSLFITPGMMQFISSQDVPDGDLPSDEEAVAFGREWLRQVNLLPANVGEGKVETRLENPPRIVVSFQPVQPAPLLSASPNITVTLGPQGSILESTYQWADISQGDIYQLRGTEAAWAEVESKRAYIETILPPDSFEAGTTITGSAEFTQVSIAYTSSGIPGQQQYLQPVYVFTGKITPEGSDESYAVTSYVPALINSQQPVG